MDSNVVKWLYLPDFHTRPNPLFLLCECWHAKNMQGFLPDLVNAPFKSPLCLSPSPHLQMISCYCCVHRCRDVCLRRKMILQCVSWLVIMWRSAEIWTLPASVNITLSQISSTAGNTTVGRLVTYAVHPSFLYSVLRWQTPHSYQTVFKHRVM